MDSPGLFDTKTEHEEIADKVVQALFQLRPGPHAFLYVVSALGKYTEEQFNAYTRFKTYFGDQFPAFTIVVFTHGDCLQSITFEQYTEPDRMDDSLKTVLDECGNRCVLFNNNSQNKESQVETLMNMVFGLMDSGKNKYFKNTLPPGNISEVLRDRVRMAEEKELQEKQVVVNLKSKTKEAEKRLRGEQQAREEAVRVKEEEQEKRKIEEAGRRKAEQDQRKAEQKANESERGKIQAEHETQVAEQKIKEEQTARQQAEKGQQKAEKQAKEEQAARKQADKEKNDTAKRTETYYKKRLADAPGKLRNAFEKEQEADSLRNVVGWQYTFSVPTLGLSTINARNREDKSKQLLKEAAVTETMYNPEVIERELNRHLEGNGNN